MSMIGPRCRFGLKSLFFGLKTRPSNFRNWSSGKTLGLRFLPQKGQVKAVLCPEIGPNSLICLRLLRSDPITH